MTNSEKICGLLGLATRAGKTVFGTEACLGAIEKKKIKILILATDAAPRTKTNFNEICKKNNIPIYEILETEKLSKSIGKSNKVVVGLTDANFSNEIKKMINGGEIIG